MEQNRIAPASARILGKAIVLFLLIVAGYGYAHSHERSAEEWFESAMKHMKEGRKTEALEAFDQSLRHDPENQIAWANRGTVLLNLGRHEEAVESYDRALALRSDDAYVYCSLATVYNRKGQAAMALLHADKALEVDPHFAPAVANKVRALKALGREEEADALLEGPYRNNPHLREYLSQE